MTYGIGSLQRSHDCVLVGLKSLLELESILPSSLDVCPKMVCGYHSLGTLAHVLSALITLATIVSAGRFGTVCNRTIYGFPDYAYCHALLSGSGGISTIDSNDHGFLLPYFGHRDQFTDWQWRQRVELPHVWRNRRCSPPWTYCCYIWTFVWDKTKKRRY